MLSVCRSLRRLLAGCAVMLLSPIAALADVPVEQKLQQVLTNFLEEHPEIPGIMVRLKSDEMHLDWRGAAGVADRESRIPIRPGQPARLASTTKTYVAAAILRLAEQQKLKLDDPIERHLSQSLNETIAFMTRVTDPLAPPGTQYLYSDGGYILLGEIVRQVSGTSLATVVRELLRFDELGLRATWWEVMEADPADLEPRISQYLFDANTRDCNPSFDLYGGGGLVATMPDVAKFYESLFAGRVFANRATLATMLTPLIPERGGPFAGGLGLGPYQYCHGIFASEHAGYTIFSHPGAWGTVGGYVPALGLSFGVSISMLDMDGGQNTLLHRLIDVLVE